jgi:hypothetical protein
MFLCESYPVQITARFPRMRWGFRLIFGVYRSAEVLIEKWWWWTWARSSTLRSTSTTPTSTGRCETLPPPESSFLFSWWQNPNLDPLSSAQARRPPARGRQAPPQEPPPLRGTCPEFNLHSCRSWSCIACLMVGFCGEFCRTSGVPSACSRAAGGCTTRSTGRSLTSCSSAARSTTSSSRSRRLPPQRICCPSDGPPGKAGGYLEL